MWGQELVRGSQLGESEGSQASQQDPDVLSPGVVSPGDTEMDEVIAGSDPATSEGVPSAKAARREVVTLLERLGFAPSPDARINVVKLKRCPLLEAANRYPAVVCAVHLGVVRGALDSLGVDPAQTERTTLEPFSEPGACRLDLVPRPTISG
jgi:predicted ArsR family transcriptional regulator